VPALVVGRHVFYNNSAFDGGSTAANAADDAAIATDKTALLPGQRATFANVTSYSKGINGVILDIDSRGDGPPPGRADFRFSVRHRAASSGWVAAPEPSSITLRRGAGAGGSDRVTITWPDGAITNTWLLVTVLPGARTGLLGPDTFSVGNLVAETGAGNTAAALVVNSFDFSRTRAAMFSDAGVSSPFDFNRDGRVSPIDLAISRSNQRRLLELFPSAPSGGPPPLAAAGATNLLEEDLS
jgi:hypothetical protein